MFKLEMEGFDMEDMGLEKIFLGVSGAKLVFGLEVMEEELLNFSFLGFVAFLLPLAGVVMMALASSEKNKLFALISAGCFVVAAVCFFLLPSFAAWAEKDYKDYYDFTVSVGAVFGAIFCLAAAACAYFASNTYVADEAVAAPVEEVVAE